MYRSLARLYRNFDMNCHLYRTRVVHESKQKILKKQKLSVWFSPKIVYFLFKHIVFSSHRDGFRKHQVSHCLSETSAYYFLKVKWKKLTKSWLWHEPPLLGEIQKKKKVNVICFTLAIYNFESKFSLFQWCRVGLPFWKLVLYGVRIPQTFS